MNRNPRRTWLQATQVFSMCASMIVGIIFGTLGKSPLDPDNLFGKNPQNDFFLWISTTAFLVAAILSYTLWPLVRAEATRKDTSIGKESPSLWYQEKNMRRASWLLYIFFFPSLSIEGIFGNLAPLIHLEIFSWLRDVTTLVSIVALIVGAVLMVKSFLKRARERETRRQTG